VIGRIASPLVVPLGDDTPQATSIAILGRAVNKKSTRHVAFRKCAFPVDILGLSSYIIYMSRGRPLEIRPGSAGGAALLRWLAEDGRSLSALAAAAGISRWTLHAVIAGERRPTYELALWLSRVAGVPYEAWVESGDE